MILVHNLWILTICLVLLCPRVSVSLGGGRCPATVYTHSGENRRARTHTHPQLSAVRLKMWKRKHKTHSADPLRSPRARYPFAYWLSVACARFGDCGTCQYHARVREQYALDMVESNQCWLIAFREITPAQRPRLTGRGGGGASDGGEAGIVQRRYCSTFMPVEPLPAPPSRRR